MISGCFLCGATSDGPGYLLEPFPGRGNAFVIPKAEPLVVPLRDFGIDGFYVLVGVTDESIGLFPQVSFKGGLGIA